MNTQTWCPHTVESTFDTICMQQGRLWRVSAGEAHLRRLHTTSFHIYDILRKDDMIMVETDQLLMGGETATEESAGACGIVL